ncbi:MAG: peptidoglycan-associated lipoprotein Pal [Nitrospirota bacterium]
MKKFFAIALFIAVFTVVGCQEKRVVKPEQPLPPQQQEQPSAAKKEPSQMERGTERMRPQEQITEQALAKAEVSEEPSRFKEERGLFEDVYFDYDKYDVRDDAKPILQKVASWLLKNTKAKLSVEGHCDERGTNEYNLALGDRRAKAVRDYLIALGVGSGRIEMVSYGEEKPACAEQTESCWAKNRRSHFVVLREAGK